MLSTISTRWGNELHCLCANELVRQTAEYQGGWVKCCKMSNFQEVRETAVFLDQSFIFKKRAAVCQSSFITPGICACAIDVYAILDMQRKTTKSLQPQHLLLGFCCWRLSKASARASIAALHSCRYIRQQTKDLCRGRLEASSVSFFFV